MKYKTHSLENVHLQVSEKTKHVWRKQDNNGATEHWNKFLCNHLSFSWAAKLVLYECRISCLHYIHSAAFPFFVSAHDPRGDYERFATASVAESHVRHRLSLVFQSRGNNHSYSRLIWMDWCRLALGTSAKRLTLKFIKNAFNAFKIKYRLPLNAEGDLQLAVL